MEFLVSGDQVRIADPERDDDGVAFSALKPLDGVDRAFNPLFLVTGKCLAKSADDGCAVGAVRRHDGDPGVPEPLGVLGAIWQCLAFIAMIGEVCGCSLPQKVDERGHAIGLEAVRLTVDPVAMGNRDNPLLRVQDGTPSFGQREARRLEVRFELGRVAQWPHARSRKDRLEFFRISQTPGEFDDLAGRAIVCEE